MGCAEVARPTSSQHHDIASRDLAAETGADRPNVHKGFVDHQQAAAVPTRIGEIEQFAFVENASVRIVRVDDDCEIGVLKLADIRDLGDVVAGQGGDTTEFRIGGAEHGRPPGRHERRYRRQ